MAHSAWNEQLLSVMAIRTEVFPLISSANISMHAQNNLNFYCTRILSFFAIREEIFPLISSANISMHAQNYVLVYQDAHLDSNCWVLVLRRSS